MAISDDGMQQGHPVNETNEQLTTRAMSTGAPLIREALEGRRLKLGDTHPHTLESWNNLIELYEAWGKPEKAKEWREKLPKTEAVDE